jgi:Ca2+-binding EF-hand superfamily protein
LIGFCRLRAIRWIASELKTAMKTFYGQDLTDEEASAMIKEADGNGDNQIKCVSHLLCFSLLMSTINRKNLTKLLRDSFDEFKKIMLQK